MSLLVPRAIAVQHIGDHLDKSSDSGPVVVDRQHDVGPPGVNTVISDRMAPSKRLHGNQRIRLDQGELEIRGAEQLLERSTLAGVMIIEGRTESEPHPAHRDRPCTAQR